jgi:hypothetical protein
MTSPRPQGDAFQERAAGVHLASQKCADVTDSEGMARGTRPARLRAVAVYAA